MDFVLVSVEMRLWYKRAIMQRQAAVIASQKGNWKLAETQASMFAPFIRFDGKLRGDEPSMGMSRPNRAAIDVIISKPATKVTSENSGFL